MIATLFQNPVEMGGGHIWLLIPLLSFVGLVYKTVRVKHLRKLPLQVLTVVGMMLAGVAVLATALYLLQEYFA